GKVLYKRGKDADEESVTAGTIIWTTGVSGSPIVAESGLKARRGRVMVNDHLNDPEYPDLYILGDVAAFVAPGEQRPYPTT
ncbi:FAD-dependent oxidoreductase, partial [Staphylococcus aureus]|uniref:FAD-dependent oxidoreductase n=1 Tax=Staphylococcus aureus TaxID=1280 RepID=UPI001E30021C